MAEFTHLKKLKALDLSANYFSSSMELQGKLAFKISLSLLLSTLFQKLESLVLGSKELYGPTITFLFFYELCFCSFLWNEKSAGAVSQWKLFFRSASSVFRWLEQATCS